MASKVYTSKEILESEDLYDIQEAACSMGQPIEYHLTDGEWQWVDFVRGRYCIADYIDQNSVNGILTIDAYAMSKALDDDNRGAGKAVCLADNTALQKIFFWLYMETEEDD